VVGPGTVELDPAEAGSQLKGVERQGQGIQDFSVRLRSLRSQGRRHLIGVVAGLLGDAQARRDGAQGAEQVVSKAQGAKNVDCAQSTSHFWNH